MKTLVEYLTEAKNKYTLFPKKKWELYKMIKQEIEKNGPNCSLNHIDITEITDLSRLFEYDNYDNKIVGSFNGDISKWDTSKVTNMEGMFKNSKFDGDISKWDVSNVTNMNSMFSNSNFNGDLSKWKLSSLGCCSWMFGGEFTKFDGSKGDISKWNVSNIYNMSEMFYGNKKFDRDLSKWNITIKDGLFMREMFKHSKLENQTSKLPSAYLALDKKWK